MFKTIIMDDAYETWTLTKSEKQKHHVFKRKIVRKIIGPSREPNGLYRKRIKKYTKQLRINRE